MNLREFRRAGHFPSLLCAFLYFDVSFMIWVLVGALATSMAGQFWPKPDDVDLTTHLQAIAPLKGLMVAIPLLGGAILRLVLGVMTDRWGARRTAIVGMVLTAVPLLLGWLWADSFPQMLLVGALLGVAGASFAAALPLASRWYPPQYQGLAMGIAGAGNSGTALATLFGPILARWLGWHAVFGIALLPLALTFAAFVVLAKDSPNQPPPKSLRAYGAVLGLADTWWFCLLYAVTFGGFVGLASFLTTYFKDQFFPEDEATGAIYAGTFTTLCVVAGSFLRPVGGYLADRFGGIRMLLALYAGVAATMGGLALLPYVGLGFAVSLSVAIGLLFLGMGLLGMGNGSVFQLVPQRFPKEIGVITGIVGAAGGVGGFFLPNLLGGLKGLTNTFSSGFAVFAATGLGCIALLYAVRSRWETTFLARATPPTVSVPALAEPEGALAPAAAN